MHAIDGTIFQISTYPISYDPIDKPRQVTIVTRRVSIDLLKP